MRPSKDQYYLNLAKEVAQRATCLRRRYGAIIVKEDSIISTGYNGAPRETPNCSDLNKCVREELKIPSGQSYEKCRSVHAEANAIVNAAKTGNAIAGGIIYVTGAEDYDLLLKPCKMCRRLIINSGIEKVISRNKNEILTFSIEDWIKESQSDPFKEISEPGY